MIIPVKDEAESVPGLAAEVTVSLDHAGLAWECLWVDDGSRDQTLAVLTRLHAMDPRHRWLSFAANAGQSAALYEGFRSARGAILATLDGDGQNDPADLPRLVGLIKEGGWDAAHGYRATRRDSWLRRLASLIANRFRTALTGKTIRDVGCSTRAFRRECVAGVPRFKGMHRFLPVFMALGGHTWTEAPVNHRPREKGTSKYTINNRLWVGIADVLGVLWLRRRAFAYAVAKRSDKR